MTIYDRPFGRYLEDFVPGDIYRHWPGKTITEADDHLFCMITMNHHPLHTNAWFAEHETVQGKNVVVGNLVYSLVLGMSVPDVSGSCIANLEVESLLHRSPTFHGDTIYAETRVLEATPSKSKDDRGIVTVETKAFNQRGEEVCYFRRKLMVWKRPPRQRADGPTATTSGTESPSVIQGPAFPGERILGLGRRQPARPPVARTRRPVAGAGQRGHAGSRPRSTGSSAYYRNFMMRFPRAGDMRPGSSGDVVRLWSGLGYNRRALNLHRTACHRGRARRRCPVRPGLPCWRCPVSAPIRARAMLSFAFEADVATVDTNVVRDLVARCDGSRVYCCARPSPGDRLLPPGRAWEFNQSMFDLGATICRPKPGVRRCPLRHQCRWKRDAWRAPDPWRASPSVRPAAPFTGRTAKVGDVSSRRLRQGSLVKAMVASACGWPDDPPGRADRGGLWWPRALPSGPTARRGAARLR